MTFKTRISIIFTLCCMAAAPSSRPGAAPFRMTAELVGPISKERMLPLKLTFYGDDTTAREYASNEFIFVLLDENGQQVIDPGFITDAVVRRVELKGPVSTYTPRLMVDRNRNTIAVGHRYQLVSIMWPTGLVSAVPFTLAK